MSEKNEKQTVAPMSNPDYPNSTVPSDFTGPRFEQCEEVADKLTPKDKLKEDALKTVKTILAKDPIGLGLMRKKYFNETLKAISNIRLDFLIKEYQKSTRDAEQIGYSGPIGLDIRMFPEAFPEAKGDRSGALPGNTDMPVKLTGKEEQLRDKCRALYAVVDVLMRLEINMKRMYAIKGELLMDKETTVEKFLSYVVEAFNALNSKN